ncbi:hypothetical protein FNJ87_05445 [Nonlabens mediterrranea]|uniref:Uncharacterized protein n=1 Tax=Nonlabens mediterrranea TaxID=1419947 RepID=A0ABS0A368_9FLAO|nr:hypothetical protein [Nonlabens mediterrranea]
MKDLEPKKDSKFTVIEYSVNKKHTSIEIAKFLQNDLANISISNGYSYDNKDDATAFIDIKVKDPDGSLDNEAIAVSVSKDVLKILRNEISNLNKFDVVHIKFFTKNDFNNAIIRKETGITLEVK